MFPSFSGPCPYPSVSEHHRLRVGLFEWFYGWEWKGSVDEGTSKKVWIGRNVRVLVYGDGGYMQEEEVKENGFMVL